MQYQLSVEIQCAFCGKKFLKAKNEISRQARAGRTHFFCSRSCSCAWGNKLKQNAIVPIEKECALCKKKFITHTGAKEAIYCSRSCASVGSMSDYRRERMSHGGQQMKANLDASRTPSCIAKRLRTREMHKYLEIRAIFLKMDIKHIFEHPVEHEGQCYVFDLFLEDYDLLVEFDGKYHDNHLQQERDRQKNLVAATLGFKLLRLQTDDAEEVIPASMIVKILEAVRPMVTTS